MQDSVYATVQFSSVGLNGVLSPVWLRAWICPMVRSSTFGDTGIKRSSLRGNRGYNSAGSDPRSISADDFAKKCASLLGNKRSHALDNFFIKPFLRPFESSSKNRELDMSLHILLIDRNILEGWVEETHAYHLAVISKCGIRSCLLTDEITNTLSYSAFM